MTDILQAIGDVIEEVVTWIVSTIQAIIPIFYTAGSGSTPGTFTFLGVLLLVSFGLGLIWTLINFVRGLVRRG